MSLIHYVKPFLDLGICKEYIMARKTTGNLSSTRGKKAGASVAPPVELQKADGAAETSEVSSEVVQDVRNGKAPTPVPINQRSMNQNFTNQSFADQGSSSHGSPSQSSPSQTSLNPSQTSLNQSSVNPQLEEEIRHRAYELYLQRRTKGDAGGGDPSQDWFTAEREILSRNGSRGRKSA
jgi:Protein of unknown function (DUF2934)